MDFLDDQASDSSPDDFLSELAPEIDDQELDRQSSLESDGESGRDESRCLPSGKFTANMVAGVCTNTKPRDKRNESIMDGSPLPKRVCHERNNASQLSEQLPYEEVKSALKDIMSLLNTVVERVERVESELQRQKSTSTDPSSSSDVTPTRTKPPLAVKRADRV